MFVNTEQIQMGVINFVEQEIAKKAVGFNKFATYFAMPIIYKKLTQYINEFSQNEIAKDFFDSNNNVVNAF